MWLQVFSEADRERLFSLWHIKQIKTRKKALSLRLWDPAVWLCADPVDVATTAAAAKHFIRPRCAHAAPYRTMSTGPCVAMCENVSLRVL